MKDQFLRVDGKLETAPCGARSAMRTGGRGLRLGPASGWNRFRKRLGLRLGAPRRGRVRLRRDQEPGDHGGDERRDRRDRQARRRARRRTPACAASTTPRRRAFERGAPEPSPSTSARARRLRARWAATARGRGGRRRRPARRARRRRTCRRPSGSSTACRRRRRPCVRSTAFIAAVLIGDIMRPMPRPIRTNAGEQEAVARVDRRCATARPARPSTISRPATISGARRRCGPPAARRSARRP